MRSIILAFALGLLVFGCLEPAEGQCGTERAYVCGTDGNTYTNACYARQAGVGVAYEGMCEAAQQNQSPPAEQCLDSDSGKNALEAGRATKGTASYNDSCAGTAAVLEYYCSNNEILSERVNCPEGLECSDGRCAAPPCLDSDGGQAIGVPGTVSRGSERKTDECVDTRTVKEYYCSEGGAISSVWLACDAGEECVNGSCSVPQCSDSDGGMDIFERGTVRAGGGVYTDYCSGTSSVKEYYCSGGRMVQVTSSCGEEYYCSDGRCVEYTCRDDDGGRDEDEFGTVAKGSREWEDECYDSDTVREYYCDGNDVEYELRNCGSGETCSGGECVRITCTDTDGGNNKAVLGTATSGGTGRTDYCVDLYGLREYFCGASGIVYDDVLCPDYRELCWKGVCSPAECEDSDGGQNPSVRGWVRLTTSNGYSDTQSDECSGRSVLERYCSGVEIETRTMQCEDDEVCENGRCVEAVCEDSDGGKEYLIAGTVTKGVLAYPDKCISGDLLEYYCSANEARSERVSCPAGCTTDRAGVAYCIPL